VLDRCARRHRAPGSTRSCHARWTHCGEGRSIPTAELQDDGPAAPPAPGLVLGACARSTPFPRACARRAAADVEGSAGDAEIRSPGHRDVAAARGAAQLALRRALSYDPERVTACGRRPDEAQRAEIRRTRRLRGLRGRRAQARPGAAQALAPVGPGGFGGRLRRGGCAGAPPHRAWRGPSCSVRRIAPVA
jgi:hypothetical protein